jgi:hypothetical protein
MTELDFLLELILDDDMPKTLKPKIKDRIAVIQTPMSSAVVRQPQPVIRSVQSMQTIEPTNTAQVGQSPSTMARLQELELPFPEPVTPKVVAQSPQAVAAIQARQQAIAQQTSGIHEKGRTSPRKW